MAAFMNSFVGAGGSGGNTAATIYGTASNQYYYATNSTSTSTSHNTIYIPPGAMLSYAGNQSVFHRGGPLTIADGQAVQIKLPDGSIIDVKADGSYTINDKDAKVIYRASRIRAFNPFLNASDRLEEFVKFCGEQGLKQDEMLNLPVKLFIAWLVQEAARADAEPIPDLQLLPDLRATKAPRCFTCKRFIPRRLPLIGINHCSPICQSKALALAA